MNAFARVSIFGALFFLGAIGAVMFFWVRSPYATGAGVIREQPVPFSHKHHVGDIGLDCRYCHTSVEDSSFAGVPPTKTCMNCHSQLFTDSPMLQPVRDSMESGEPLVWTRVHDLPDYAYFNHSAHINKGVGCKSCHGAVNEMPLMWREKTLQMEWCLSCHRAPEEHIRPIDKVFDMEYDPSTMSQQEREKLLKEYHVQSKVHCSVCHR